MSSILSPSALSMRRRSFGPRSPTRAAEHRVSRRKVLGAAGLTLPLVACADATPGPASALESGSGLGLPRSAPAAGAIGGPTTLRLIGWPFRPDLLRERLSAFEASGLNVVVEHEQALRDYGNRAAAAISRDPPVDVVQVREGLLGLWWSSGVLRPLGAETAWQATLDAMWPHARASLSIDGQVAALPQYSDAMVLAYNRPMLERLGVAPPRTLEELGDIGASAVRRGLVEFPLTLNLTPKVFANLPWWALVYACGGTMLPTGGVDPVTLSVLTWLRQAIAVDRLVDPAFLESTYATLALGKHLFGVVGGYMLKPLNTPAPGTFDIAPVPGLKGPAGTVAWCSAYAVNQASPNPELAIALARFLGAQDDLGQLTSASFWMRTEGLTPAYPAVLDDPGVQSDVARWANLGVLREVMAQARPLEGQWRPWFIRWENELQTLVQDAIFGHVEPAQALATAGQRATELSAQEPG